MTRAGWIRTGIVAGGVFALESVCRTGMVSPATLIAPSAMLGSMAEVLASEELRPDIFASVGTIAAATALTCIAGICAGLALHALPRVRSAIDPLLASYYALPLFAFYPLFIVVFGVGFAPIMVMGFLTGLAAMVLATLNGLDAIPSVLFRTARMYRMGWLRRAWKIQMPAAAPQLFNGVRLAVAYASIGVIASEFIMSGRGLGFQIGFAYNALETRRMYGLILLLILLVVLMNGALDALDRRMQRHRHANVP